MSEIYDIFKMLFGRINLDEDWNTSLIGEYDIDHERTAEGEQVEETNPIKVNGRKFKIKADKLGNEKELGLWMWSDKVGWLRVIHVNGGLGIALDNSKISVLHGSLLKIEVNLAIEDDPEGLDDE